MLETSYAIHRKLPHLDHASAVARVTETLGEQGFGVLTTIDIQATLEQKLSVEHRPYVILGACNPPIAHQALQAEPAVGLLLPCNVVVTIDDDETTEVAAVDPAALLGVTGRGDLDALADDVRARLKAAIDAA